VSAFTARQRDEFAAGIDRMLTDDAPAATCSGQAHAAAEQYGQLDDGAYESLREDIAANGVLFPIIVDADGLIVDGRHRWQACQELGINPPIEPLGDRDPYAVALSANVETKPMSSGQRAMHRALDLARQGKRKGGRWAKGSSATNVADGDYNAWRKLMEKAGAVIDAAAKAAAMKPAPGIDADTITKYATMPQQVTDGSVSLDYAYNQAKKFEQVATLAEMALYEPLTKYLGELTSLADDLAVRYGQWPHIEAPLRAQDRRDAEAIAKSIGEWLRTFRLNLKESQ